MIVCLDYGATTSAAGTYNYLIKHGLGDAETGETTTGTGHSATG